MDSAVWWVGAFLLGILMPQPEELLEQQSGGDRTLEPTRGYAVGQ
jgi:hypothetical protein